MELNKNKLIFLWIGAMILTSFIFLLSILNNKKDDVVDVNWDNVFKIWIVWDDSSQSNDFIEWFKQLNTAYKNENIIIESFPSYEDYTYTMISALNAWKWPDIFVLNNNEKKSVFSDQTIWIDPKIINPNDFRKKYKWIFWDDLIQTSWTEWDTIEFLAWIPVWYETLWIFYNRKYIRDTNLKSLSGLNDIVIKLKERYKDLTPIWIWNWTTVYNSSDIITQFFMLEKWVTWVKDLAWKILKQWLWSYLLYGDIDWYNKFNSKYVELRNIWEDSLYLFSRWEILMVVGYPSLIKKIKANWFSKTFLQASSFPHYYSWEWKTLANYNYFVINKETKRLKMAQDFLYYLSTDNWASKYLSYYPYYLPALLSLEADKLDEKIDPDFNLTLKDFYNDEYELSSFDKWIKILYDQDIEPLLDNSLSYENNFEKFKESILCRTNKIINFTNLSKICK